MLYETKHFQNWVFCLGKCTGHQDDFVMYPYFHQLSKTHHNQSTTKHFNCISTFSLYMLYTVYYLQNLKGKR